MSLPVLFDRVLETTTTTGTGSLILAGATSGYQTFSATVGTGNTCYYCVELNAAGQWEVGVGTLTSPNVLSRDTVLASSNADSLVNFIAGNKNVFLPLPAEKTIYGERSPFSLMGNPFSTTQASTDIVATGANPGVLGFVPLQPSGAKVKWIYNLGPQGLLAFVGSVPTFYQILPIEFGGLGVDSYLAAITALLPDQTGHAGARLVTDGSNLSWQTPPPAPIPTTPGAPDTAVQYNSGGGFAGSSNLVYSNGTLIITSAGGSTTPLRLNVSSSGGLTAQTWFNTSTNTILAAINDNGQMTLSGDLFVDNGVFASTLSGTLQGSDVAGDISGNAANVTGTVAIGNGGTGATNKSAALINLLPVLQGNKVLSNNGTSVFWSNSPAGGSSPQLQYNNGGFVDGTQGMTYGPAGNLLNLNPRTTSERAVLIKAQAGQTANLIEWQDSFGATLGRISPAGVFTGNGGGLTNIIASNLSGTVAIANGGTGQATANAAINALLPTQSDSTTGLILQSDGTNISWQTVAGGASGGRVFYYDVTDASDISGYKRMLNSPSANPEATVAVACTGTGDFAIGNFATDSGVPGSVSYPAGTAFRRIYAKVSGGSAQIHLQVYKRTVAGVETLVRDELSPPFTDTSVTLQEWLASPSVSGTLLTSDRIVNKIYAQRVSGPATVTVTVYFEGSSHTSHIQTTIPAGVGLPAAGTTGQALCKVSNTDFDVSWQTVSGGSGTPGGSSGQLQYNNSGAFGGLTGTLTNTGGNLLKVQAQSISVIPLVAQGAVGQTSPLQQWWDSSQTPVAEVQSNGHIYTTGGFEGNGSLINNINALNITSGTLAITRGGTGQTTANAAHNALLPSQTGNANKVLQTDGSNSSWVAPTSPVTPTFALALGIPAVVGTNITNQVIVPTGGTITKVFAAAKTGPTGAALVFDINLNGTSIWATTQANRIQIAASATTGNQTSFDTTAVSAGDLLTIDIDQVGSTVAGQDITVMLLILGRNS